MARRDLRFDTVTGSYLATDVSGMANVRDYGAVGDGTTNDRQAFVDATATGRPVYVPEGIYRYGGAGLTGQGITIVGGGNFLTNVVLDAGTYFIDDNQEWFTFHLSGIRFANGAGHVRNRFTGTNVTNPNVVVDCAFVDYTTASISNESSDHPYWKIERNYFQAANDTVAIGVALSGLTDGSTIVDNEFTLNRVHVKLRRGGNNAYLARNDFVRFNAFVATPRIDVWFVPNNIPPTFVNAGDGMVLTQCKFGNENLNAADYRILYADEGAGTFNGDRLPVLTASTGYIVGHTVRDVNQSDIGGTIPLVYSTTPNVAGCAYGPVTQSGSIGAPLLASLSPIPMERNWIRGAHGRDFTAWTGVPRTPTASRPPATRGAGAVVFDTTINRLIVSDGTNWLDPAAAPWAAELVTNYGALADGYNDAPGGVRVDRDIVLTDVFLRLGDNTATVAGTGNLTYQIFLGSPTALETTLVESITIAAGQHDKAEAVGPQACAAGSVLRVKYTRGTTNVAGPIYVQLIGRYA